MAGHSHWAGIKHKKAAIDAKRGKLWSKLARGIIVAAKAGGGDPNANLTLRYAIDKAKDANMPKDTIQRAISKANKDNSSFMELTFEGMLPHGIGVFVDCLTDNRNRTVSNMRCIFNKRGGNLGTNGSLSFMFDRKGVISLAKGELDPEEFELELIDAGVEELELEEDTFMITTPMEDFHNVQKKLQEMGLEADSAELQRIPNDALDLTVEQGVQIMKIVEEFEDDDDVQAVSHNLNVTDEVSEAING